MSSPLRRLGQSLAGKPPSEALQSPPEGQKPFLATSPPPPPPEPPPAPPLVKSTLAQLYPYGSSRARLLTHAGRTQSLLRWSREVSLDRRVLAWRLDHGWPVDQALGLTPHPPRDRAAEQAHSLATRKNTGVLIIDGERIVPRREAAARLGVKLRSLTHRLRQYRTADGSTTRVPLSLLEEKSRR